MTLQDMVAHNKALLDKGVQCSRAHPVRVGYIRDNPNELRLAEVRGGYISIVRGVRSDTGEVLTFAPIKALKHFMYCYVVVVPDGEFKVYHPKEQ